MVCSIRAASFEMTVLRDTQVCVVTAPLQLGLPVIMRRHA